MNLKVSKIVGSLSADSWSQVHAFKPDDGKIDSHGELLAAISFKAKQEADISSFGSEIIQRLQEIYYSNEADSVVKKLSQTIETLAAEFLATVDLEIVAVVVWQGFLYAAKNASGQAWLKRGEALVGLFPKEGMEAVSGRLEPGDTVLAATGQFVSLVPEGSLLPALGQESAESVCESLSAQVHGHEDSSRTAAVVIKDETEAEIAPAPVPKQEAVKLASLWARLKPKHKPEIFLGRKIDFKKRTTLIIAAALILVFCTSLVLAGKKRQGEESAQADRAVADEVNYQLTEANNLLTLNPLRARSLLNEAQSRIKEYKGSVKKPAAEILDLEAKVAAALEQVQREYAVEASEWYDFDLVKEGFKGGAWDLSEKEVLVWDDSSHSLVLLNLETKAAKIVISDEGLGEAKTIGLTGNRGYVAAADKVSVIDTDKEKKLSETEADGWQKITRARGFGSNLYLLDSASSSQIWKYLGMEAGLSSKRSYLVGDSYNLSEAVDMAIDASVWALFSDGSIVKYTQGKKDAFGIVGLDQPFAEAVKIFTGPEEEHLYVLDRANTRVVVLDKSGDYAAQYAWSGIAGVKDMAVSEALGKIFFLTGEKVFTIELRQ